MLVRTVLVLLPLDANICQLSIFGIVLCTDASCNGIGIIGSSFINDGKRRSGTTSIKKSINFIKSL